MVEADNKTGMETYVHKFRADPNPQNSTSSGSSTRVQKRNRPIVSCLSCRNRKSKCDREHPVCGTCKANGTTCVYRSGVKDEGKPNAQDRLALLENLVLQLMKDKDSQSPQSHIPSEKILTPPAESSASTEDAPDNDDRIDHSQGAFSNGIHGPSFVGPTNWEAVIDTIHGLRSELAFTEEFQNDQSRNDKTRESLFTTPCPTNLNFVLQTLPRRDKATQLLTAYFDGKILCMPIVHRTAFERMYAKFWVNPSIVPVLWISQMFSMLAVGSLIYETAERDGPADMTFIPARNQLLRAAAQCLVFANWERPQRHVIEAFFMYIMGKIVAGTNPACDNDEVWVLYGAMVRQAYRLGYHREPSQIPGISVFDAEMRRRSWHLLRQFDIIGNLQYGLPFNIADDGSADVQQPRNLLDTDFDEDSIELPPARKPTDVTSMVYYIAKGALMEQLRILLHRQLTKKMLSYDEDVMQIDNSLRAIYSSIPSILKVEPMAQSYATPPWMIINRIKVEILYLRSLCVLHRHHLDADPRHQYSIDTCVEASTRIMKHQQAFHSEAIFGGKLAGNRYIVTAMHFSDFFLGAVVMGFLLCNFDAAKLGGDERVAEMGGLLHSALAIQNALQASFREAVKFSSAIEIILRRIEGPQLDSMQFDFQSFSGPTMVNPSSDTSSPGTYANSSALQEFEGFLDNTNGIDWTLIDASLSKAQNPIDVEFNWVDPDPDSAWMDTFGTTVNVR